jgi:hypothetical protein
MATLIVDKDSPVSNQPTSLWRNRDYLFLVSGQAISSMGTEVSDLAYILLVLALTGSPAQVGFVGALVGIALTGILIQNLGVVASVLIISGCRILIALAATLNAHVRNAPPAIKVR